MTRVNARPKAELDPVIFILGMFRRIQEHGGHHPKVMDNGGIAVAYGLPPTARVEAIQLHNTASRHQHDHTGTGHGIHMYQWQGRQQALHTLFHRAQAAHVTVPLGADHKVFIG